MIEILHKEGFSESENKNEFVKGNWTVRLENDLVEVFNNPEYGKGVYYAGLSSAIDLQTILDEIANFEFNQDF